jgi:hypothetical protein
MSQCVAQSAIRRRIRGLVTGDRAVARSDRRDRDFSRTEVRPKQREHRSPEAFGIVAVVEYVGRGRTQWRR